MTYIDFMSIQVQSILLGHLRPDDIASVIEKVTGNSCAIRPMHQQTYKIIEISNGFEMEALHVFLESSVAEDYRELTSEPSTFISAQESPFTSAAVRRLAETFGGFHRSSDHEPWQRIDRRVTD